MAGKYTILDEKLIKEICKHIKSGLTNKDALIMSCVGKTAFYEWMSTGKSDIEDGKVSIYTNLVESVEKAKIGFKRHHIKNIADHSKENWTASAWLLERKFHEEFGKKTDLNLKGSFDINKFDIELTAEEKELYKKRIISMYGKDVFGDENE